MSLQNDLHTDDEVNFETDLFIVYVYLRLDNYILIFIKINREKIILEAVEKDIWYETEFRKSRQQTDEVGSKIFRI